ncbi:MAG: hypothetical protein AB4426_27955 [Xenococcaceae cyanobacterium]
MFWGFKGGQAGGAGEEGRAGGAGEAGEAGEAGGAGGDSLLISPTQLITQEKSFSAQLNFLNYLETLLKNIFI